MKLQIMMWRVKLVNLEELGSWETFVVNSERHKAQAAGVPVLRKARRPRGPGRGRRSGFHGGTWGPTASEHRAARSGTGSGCPSPSWAPRPGSAGDLSLVPVHLGTRDD